MELMDPGLQAYLILKAAACGFLLLLVWPSRSGKKRKRN